MSNYVKSTNFAIKDNLVTTDPAKIIKGTEIDNEYNAISNAIASKADVNSPSLTGTPTAPTATAGTNTTQLATCAFATAAAAAAFPSGGIIMWSGLISAIPSGWYLCNGSNSTPDLRDRFIVGASADSGGAAKTNITGSYTQTGGSKDSIVVSHTHSASQSSHSHYISGGSASSSLSSGNVLANAVDVASGLLPNENFEYALQGGGTTANTGLTNSVTPSITVSSTGDSGTNKNLPPYYALAFIMKA